MPVIETVHFSIISNATAKLMALVNGDIECYLHGSGKLLLPYGT